jgi:hypothetical protein
VRTQNISLSFDTSLDAICLITLVLFALYRSMDVQQMDAHFLGFQLDRCASNRFLDFVGDDVETDVELE